MPTSVSDPKQFSSDPVQTFHIISDPDLDPVSDPTYFQPKNGFLFIVLGKIFKLIFHYNI